MSLHTTRPEPKVYTDGAGHRREVHPTETRIGGEWYFNYSRDAYCVDECPVCNSPEQDDYAGERWEED